MQQVTKEERGAWRQLAEASRAALGWSGATVLRLLDRLDILEASGSADDVARAEAERDEMREAVVAAGKQVEERAEWQRMAEETISALKVERDQARAEVERMKKAAADGDRLKNQAKRVADKAADKQAEKEA